MRVYLRRLAVAPFEAAAAVAAVAIGLAGFLGVPLDIIYEALPTMADAWSAGYAIGGILILGGLATGARAVEIIGLAMLGCGTTVQAVAIMAVTDGIGLPHVVISRLAFTAAALARIHSLTRGHLVVEVAPDGTVR